MKKFKVFIIHGIGKHNPGYSKEFQDALVERIEKNTEKKYKIQFEEICYSDIIDNKINVFTKLELNMDLSYKELRKLFNYYANDAIAYGIPSVKKNILKRIYQYDKPDKKTHTLYIGHSLGSIVLFDYLTHHKINPGSIFTLGSPLGLYLEYQSNLNKIRSISKKPLWVNIIGKDDPIAKPIPLPEVDMNYIAKVGSIFERQTPLCHTAYFENDGNVIKPIAKRISMLIENKFNSFDYKKYVRDLWNV